MNKQPRTKSGRNQSHILQVFDSYINKWPEKKENFLKLLPLYTATFGPSIWNKAYEQ